MGMDYDEFMPIGASTAIGQGSSSKEGDSGWTNLNVRSGAADWPGLVIQAGASCSGAGYEGECLACLQADDRWLLEHSQGQINIVLLIWIKPANKRVLIEKWISGTQFTSLRFNVLRSAEISIDQSTTPAVITGAPLVLEFEKVFCRSANRPQGKDIEFDERELNEWARTLFVGL